jgi:hypothetical protein
MTTKLVALANSLGGEDEDTIMTAVAQLAEAAAEIERLRAEAANASEMASEILRVRALNVPAFLDRLADMMGGWDGNLIDDRAADCRAMAARLKGEA